MCWPGKTKRWDRPGFNDKSIVEILALPFWEFWKKIGKQRWKMNDLMGCEMMIYIISSFVNSNAWKILTLFWHFLNAINIRFFSQFVLSNCIKVLTYWMKKNCCSLLVCWSCSWCCWCCFELASSTWQWATMSSL